MKGLITFILTTVFLVSLSANALTKEEVQKQFKNLTNSVTVAIRHELALKKAENELSEVQKKLEDVKSRVGMANYRLLKAEDMLRQSDNRVTIVLVRSRRVDFDLLENRRKMLRDNLDSLNYEVSSQNRVIDLSLQEFTRLKPEMLKAVKEMANQEIASLNRVFRGRMLTEKEEKIREKHLARIETLERTIQEIDEVLN